VIADEEKQTLLVVDDNPETRQFLTAGLSDAGYQVRSAAGQDDTLRLLQEHPVDLVLLESVVDHGNPGLDLLRLLRATHDALALPVILLTAGNDGNQMVEALSTGANDFVTKPVDFPVMLARIAAQLQRKRAEDAFRDSAQRYELAARSTSDGLWDWHLRRGTFYLSPNWKTLLGYQDEEVPNKPEEWISRVHEDDRARLQLLLSEISSDNGPNELLSEHRMQHRSGTFRWVQVRGGVLRDVETGAAIRIAGAMTDITAKRIYDPLTGLPNRVFLMEALEKALEYTEGHSGWGFALVILNLDHYGQINTVFGHSSGDQLLVETASRLQRAVRSGPGGDGHLVAHIGGDEFAVLLGGVTDIEIAQKAAGRIQAEFGHAFLLEGTEVYACATIGIALWHEGYRKATEIVRDVDIAIRAAKAKGEAKINVFDLSMQQDAFRSLELSMEVQRGLDLDEYEVYYQPVIELETGAVRGFEGLLRWHHPTRGVLAPSQFLEHAEDTGLVIPLGVFTLRHAAVTIRQLRHRFPRTPELYVSVNVSPREIRQPGLASRVEDIITTAGIEPPALVLEVNQRAFRGDGETAAMALHQVKTLGVRLRLDNAEIEPSALRYLSRGLFDSVKISRSLANNMTTNEQSADVVRTLCTLAKGLGIESLVEGVESNDQAEMALSAGCLYAQGYLFAPPLTVDEAVDYTSRLP
jgi:diguanylate cyclase (GGDEF)-like protein/PAS domain S-box-containing protein